MNPNAPTDALFLRAFDHGLATIPAGSRRGALAGITGHVAESVTEVLLESYGYVPVWHHDRTGRHGVDLVLLHITTEMVFAVEVKGTLRPGRWPRLTRRDVEQMSPEWLNKPTNPGMQELTLAAEDLYGAVVLINFADRLLRAALSADFTELHPVRDLQHLAEPSWLGRSTEDP